MGLFYRPRAGGWHLQRSLLQYCAIGLCILGFAAVARAQSAWNRFRGDNGSGVLVECEAPLPWKESDIAWKVSLPGKGNGSPIIHGDYVYVMSADPETAERYVLSYDLASGKERWRGRFASTKHPLHSRSSYASSTPCADDDAVYVAWGAPDAVVLKPSRTLVKSSGRGLWNAMSASMVLAIRRSWRITS